MYFSAWKYGNSSCKPGEKHGITTVGQDNVEVVAVFFIILLGESRQATAILLGTLDVT